MGFRWVNWQTSYSNPSNFTFGAATDGATVDVNGYVPLLGIMTSMKGLTVGAVAFPTTLGTVEHLESIFPANRLEAKGDFNGGYFAEIFMDWTMPAFELPGMEAGLSIFSKISFLRTTADVTFRNLAAPAVTQEYDFALQRNLFFLGAKATIDFEIPDWPSTRILYY